MQKNHKIPLWFDVDGNSIKHIMEKEKRLRKRIVALQEVPLSM
jgi:hypothetical protein